MDPLGELAQGLGHGRVEPPDGLGAAEDEEDAAAWRDAEALAAASRSISRVSRIGVPVT
jgi:hypothetical protein